MVRRESAYLPLTSYNITNQLHQHCKLAVPKPSYSATARLTNIIRRSRQKCQHELAQIPLSAPKCRLRMICTPPLGSPLLRGSPPPLMSLPLFSLGTLNAG